ncbi:MAG: hypothetical protein MRY21_07895 [Simkaniaceae bacterium]|nr:hypothetical protein [Simkaniaceae bacterium]
MSIELSAAFIQSPDDLEVLFGSKSQKYTISGLDENQVAEVKSVFRTAEEQITSTVLAYTQLGAGQETPLFVAWRGDYVSDSIEEAFSSARILLATFAS